MLERLTIETFAGRLGEAFTLVADEQRLPTELVEATVHGEATETGRAPFSIVFRGPADPVLPQRIYHFEHAELGDLELFVVPIGRDAEGVLYEAVFT